MPHLKSDTVLYICTLNHKLPKIKSPCTVLEIGLNQSCLKKIILRLASLQFFLFYKSIKTKANLNPNQFIALVSGYCLDWIEFVLDKLPILLVLILLTSKTKSMNCFAFGNCVAISNNKCAFGNPSYLFKATGKTINGINLFLRSFFNL